MTTVIEQVSKKDIPPQWAKKIKDDNHQNFTLIIKE